MGEFKEIVDGLLPYVSEIKPAENSQDLDHLIALADYIVDRMDDDETPGLESLLILVGTLIHDYESRQPLCPESDAVDNIRMLMETHGLKQIDLTELGSQEEISEILNGKRLLNIDQVKALSKRFRCSPALFID